MNGISNTDRPRGRQISNAVRALIIDRLRQWFLPTEEHFAEFEATAREILASRVNEPHFRFVVRRLWREWFGELPGNWKELLPGRYADFVQRFEWNVSGAPEWVSDELVVKTLCIFQPLYVIDLKAKHAVEMILGVSRLADFVGAKK